MRCPNRPIIHVKHYYSQYIMENVLSLMKIADCVLVGVEGGTSVAD